MSMGNGKQKSYLSLFPTPCLLFPALEITDNRIDDEPGGNGYDESDYAVLYRLGSFFLLLGRESEKTHLKGPVDDHDDCDRCRESEDEIGGIVDDSRYVSETDISAPQFVGVDSAEYSGVRVCIRIRGGREYMLRKKRSSAGYEQEKKSFHKGMA